jgi:hypothetical protein
MMVVEMVCGVRWRTVFLNKAHVSCNLTDVKGGVRMCYIYVRIYGIRKKWFW